jgi:hypothetical protein
MPRLARRMVRTAAVMGTATAVSGNVSRRQDARHAADAPVAQAPVVDTGDQLAQLEQLGRLKEQGILTEAEFAAKKAQILGL